jgi:hypothetical protein
VVRRLDRNPSFENAEFSRTLWPDRTLMEMVHLDLRAALGQPAFPENKDIE